MRMIGLHLAILLLLAVLSIFMASESDGTPSQRSSML